MKNHLTPDEITAVVAGLELEPETAAHLEDCVICRAEAAEMDRLIAVRREVIEEDAPDWGLQATQIMDCLTAEPAPGRRPGSRWLRPLLAVAAVTVMAVGLGVLRPDGPQDLPEDDVSVEEILAEMDELLSHNSIPGFEIIDPETDDLETYFDNGAS